MPGNSGNGDATASTGQPGGASTGGEPGFDTGGDGGGQALPDLRDEPTQQGGLPGFEDVMADAGQPPGGQQGSQSGSQQGGQSGSGNSSGSKSGSGSSGAAGAYPGLPGGMGGSGPLTPAEQVAILDARLEQGTGEFDAMILEEQTAQRQAERDNPAPAPAQPEQAGGGSGGNSPYGGDMADAGGYSTGGGMGGASRGGGQVPQNTAKYPPPADIPSGDDDDVVARQLREAAMREPDPKVREALWDEYRKYKGISP
ncbi:hypothetical protein [Parahaliea mediterranea]|uniref:hypothetical protein n=1 Tax=Parahaliea mediterranea TaxID=651086 RepID=UPI0013004E9B|nr:hypothetical protein [Parahaliea mediterranea]